MTNELKRRSRTRPIYSNLLCNTCIFKLTRATCLSGRYYFVLAFLWLNCGFFWNFSQYKYFRRIFPCRRTSRTNDPRLFSYFKTKSTTFESPRRFFKWFFHRAREIFRLYIRTSRVAIISSRRIGILICVFRFLLIISFRRSFRFRFVNFRNWNFTLLFLRDNNCRGSDIHSCSTYLVGLMFVCGRVFPWGKGLRIKTYQASVFRTTTRMFFVNRSKGYKNSNHFMDKEGNVYLYIFFCPSFKKETALRLKSSTMEEENGANARASA